MVFRGMASMILPTLITVQLVESMGTWLSGRIMALLVLSRYADKPLGKLWTNSRQHYDFQGAWSYPEGRTRAGDSVSSCLSRFNLSVNLTRTISGYGCLDHFLEGACSDAICRSWYLGSYLQVTLFSIPGRFSRRFWLPMQRWALFAISEC